MALLSSVLKIGFAMGNAHRVTVEVGCAACGVIGLEHATAAYRTSGLWLGIGFHCTGCSAVIETDHAGLTDRVRSAFYAAEGKWSIAVAEIGTRAAAVVQVIRGVVDVSLGRAFGMARQGVPFFSGALVEIEEIEHRLVEVGATATRERAHDSDPDVVLAANRARPLADRVREHEALWTTELARWALLPLTPCDPRSAILIVDPERPGVLLVDDDDEVYDLLVRRMRDAGVRTLSELPEARLGSGGRSGSGSGSRGQTR